MDQDESQGHGHAKPEHHAQRDHPPRPVPQITHPVNEGRAECPGENGQKHHAKYDGEARLVVDKKLDEMELLPQRAGHGVLLVGEGRRVRRGPTDRRLRRRDTAVIFLLEKLHRGLVVEDDGAGGDDGEGQEGADAEKFHENVQIHEEGENGGQ